MPKMKKLKRKNDSQLSSRSLNDFHDAILKHILSFLPTKFAVQTSVLSKRWQYMWTSLPNLDFQECTIGSSRPIAKRKRFMNFVDRALIFHSVSLVRKFSLKCEVKADVSRIKTWISGVVRLNAQEFDIEFLSNYHDDDEKVKHVLPFCLLNCDTMEVLKLKIHFGVQLPSQICLPRLKILTLIGITFKDSHSTNILFASPVLEQLFMESCTWEGGNNEIIISASKLLNLTIDESHVERTDDELLDSNSIIISAPGLEIFKYKGAFLKDYRFPCSNSIVNATLWFDTCMDSLDIIDNHCGDFLSSFQLVKYLKLSPRFIVSLHHPTMPIFKNVVFLEVCDSNITPGLSCEELESIDSKFPCLETLRFLEGFRFCRATYNFDRLLNLNFNYLPSTLKEIMIGKFSGKIEEISFVQVLLAKLTSLETMEIVFTKKARGEIKTILSSFPMGSKSCKLIIS